MTNLLNYKKYFILTVILFVIGNFAFAQGVWTPGQPIVPCGGVTVDANGAKTAQPDCTKCDLFKLARNIIDLILFAVTPILATLFFIIAGVMMMLGGSNPGMLSQGKRIFKDTMIGLVIVMLAWLITNTLVRTLIDPSKIQGGNWFEYQCTP